MLTNRRGGPARQARSTSFVTTHQAMLGFWLSAGVLLASVLVASSPSAAAPTVSAGETTRVSVDSNETQANGQSGRFGGFVDVSGDGRSAVFVSEASNLVTGDANGASDVFVRDLESGVTELASATPAGAVGNASSNRAFISHDGRFVVFTSGASDLVSGDTNGRTDVFVRDRALGTTELVSVSSDEVQGNNLSFGGAASADGRYVTFTSYATNLVTADTNGTTDIFVRDRQLGTTERVSLTDMGTEANGLSQEPRISADGNLVFFESDATNVAVDDTNGYRDVFVRDRAAATTERVSFRTDGTQIVTCCGASGTTISADGRFVLFTSQSNVDGLSAFQEAYLHDRQLDTTERASLTDAGGIGNIGGSVGSYTHGVSDDGRFVVFSSSSTNMVADDTNGHADVFVRDRLTASTTRVSLGADGSQGNGASGNSAISADGSVVAFDSAATNLVADDTNGFTDVFVNGFVNDVTPEPGSVTIVKQTDPAGGTGFTFTGPAGATPTGDGTLSEGGDSVVFHRNNDGLFLLDVATGTETALAGTTGAWDPEFSPDSSKIAYNGPSTTLGVFDVASGTVDVIVDSSHNLHASHPSWSPDGNWIVFHAGDDLYAVPSDGSEAPTQLTNTLLAETFPVWGPDGRIAWRTNAASPNVRVATFDATTKTLVGETGLGSLPSQHRAMHWSPDGTQLAAGAAINSASDTDLYVLADDGGSTWTATRLTAEVGYDTDPTWTPDGSQIIYRGQGASSFDLFSVPADGSATRTLFYAGTGDEAGADWGQAGTTSTYTLDHGDSIGGLVPAGESVTFAELATSGYDLASIVCDSASAVVDAASVTVTPQAGEAVTCTFTNVPSLLDTDGDGVPDDTDNCADIANGDQADLDGDGTGDACDDDIDGDGLSNVIEIWLGCNPYDPDSDGDGVWDLVEILVGTNPLLGDTDDDGEGDSSWLLRIYGPPCGCGYGDDTNGNGVWDLVEYHYFGGLYDVNLHGGGGFGSLAEYLFHQCGCSPDELGGDGIPRIVRHLWGSGGLTSYIVRCGCHPWEDPNGGGGISVEFLSLLGGGLDDDPDGDGIITVIEILLGCNPFDDDTDGDGLSDYDEVFVYGTLVDDPDTDGDGMLDGVEIALGCDPHDPDSDGDGVLDGADSAPLAYVHECRIDVTGPIPVGATVTATTDMRGQVTGARLRWGDGGVKILAGVGTASFQYAYDAAGIHVVDCDVTDTTGGTQTSDPSYVVVFDPSAGFVTGGGWIDSPAGAYVPDPAAAGPARFGFVSQYKKGATVPTGSTQFQFQAGNLNLHSNEFDWLVVSGTRAQFRGTGSVNGVGGYRFTVTVIDGDLIAKGRPDRFRMRIWAPGGGLVYDNQMGAADGDHPTTAITQGSIVIHKKGNK